jgi:hypothetical protein
MEILSLMGTPFDSACTLSNLYPFIMVYFRLAGLDGVEAMNSWTWNVRFIFIKDRILDNLFLS